MLRKLASPLENELDVESVIIQISIRSLLKNLRLLSGQDVTPFIIFPSKIR